MASGIFAVLDDIASLMDDVAIASKVAARKTAGILGDDLAVNAEKATGFETSRELPVLWAIIKGSLLNKVIIIPIAIVLNIFLPVAIKYILIFGGIYLAYEGVEKMYEYFFHHKKGHPDQSAVEEIKKDAVSEKEKIKSAIITDFILSIEIVIIGLSTVLHDSLAVQIITVAIVALIATVGVYGLVAMIVRMDDTGYKLMRRSGKKKPLYSIGKFLVVALPWVIKSFSVIGTIALILVSGGIFVHEIAYFHHLVPQFPALIKEAIIGLVFGSVALILMSLGKKIFPSLGEDKRK